MSQKKSDVLPSEVRVYVPVKTKNEDVCHTEGNFCPNRGKLSVPVKIKSEDVCPTVDNFCPRRGKMSVTINLSRMLYTAIGLVVCTQVVYSYGVVLCILSLT